VVPNIEFLAILNTKNIMFGFGISNLIFTKGKSQFWPFSRPFIFFSIATLKLLRNSVGGDVEEILKGA